MIREKHPWLVRTLQGHFVRYVVAIVAVLAMALLRAALHSPTDHSIRFIAFVMSVLLSVWFGGIGPALLALFFGALIGSLAYNELQLSFHIVEIDEVRDLVLYFFVGSAVIYLFNRLEQYASGMKSEITRRQEVEQQLRTNEERLRLAMSAGRVGIWDWDLLTGKITWDASNYALYGVEPGTPISIDDFWTFIHPDDRAMLMNKAYGEPFEGEFRIVRPDGDVCWLISRERSVHDASGQIIGKIGINADVSERKHQEERTNRLRELTNALSIALRIDDVVRVIGEQGLAAIGAHPTSGGIARLSPDGKSLGMLLFGPPEDAAESRIRSLELNAVTPMTDAIRKAEPIWISSLEEFRERYPHMDSMQLKDARALVCLPLSAHGHLLGGLCVVFDHPHPFSPVDRSFIQAIAQVCAQALERARLFEKEQELTIVQERQHIARELHDAVSQTMFAATTMADSVERIWPQDPNRAFEILQQVITLNRSAYSEMRTLLLELRPEAIVRSSLRQLFHQLGDAVRGKKTMQIHFRLPEHDIVLPPDVHVEFYRIAQEAITNIVKHSAATQLTLSLHEEADVVQLEICDDGVGFDIAQRYSGLGITSMSERAGTIGAEMEIDSQPGKGTTIRLRWDYAGGSDE